MNDENRYASSSGSHHQNGGGRRAREQPEQIFGTHRQQQPQQREETESNASTELMFQKRTKLAKSSGKKVGYMLWMYSAGVKLFYNKFNVRFDCHNQEHQAQMGTFWQQVPPDERQKYKDQAKLENLDREEVRRRRIAGNQRRRQINHDNAAAHYEQQTNHFRELHRRQERFRDAKGMACLPKIENAWNRLPFLDSHIEAKRQKDREQLMKVLSFRMLDGTTNPLMQGSNTTIQIISIFPITFVYQMNHKSVFTYPAEINITTFTLKDGISRRATALVAFDQDAFYNGNANENNEEYVRDEETRKAYSASLGISESGPRASMGPYEAFRWVVNQLEKNSFRLCDANQYTFVAYGLRTLAMLSGMKAQVQFQKEIVEHLITVQDFVLVLCDKLECNGSNEKLSKESLENEFKNNFLLPKKNECKHHTSSGMPLSCQYQCCEAHSLRMIHITFDVLAYHGLNQFRRTNNHVYCEDTESRVGDLPMAPPIEDDEEEGFVREEPMNGDVPSTSTAGESAISTRRRPVVTYGAPVDDLHPLFTDLHRRHPIEFCREMLNIYSESDSDEDVETFNEVYTANAGPSSSTVTERRIQPFRTVEFRRESAQNNYYNDDYQPVQERGPSFPVGNGFSSSNLEANLGMGFGTNNRQNRSFFFNTPAIKASYLVPVRPRKAFEWRILDRADSAFVFRMKAENDYNDFEHPAVRPFIEREDIGID